ncbi:hypothetical protein BmHG_00328 [Borrelia miyamotoi]|uniref:Uncharacterized protein n=1 Tax=Borrelia miyamotoi TaxID=47466 RepID=A0AAP9CFU8_9SPIR|nr:hypothetical protein [Borrelia miyamotoi]AHH05091.1 Hypothetical protein BOM_0548 [Borrelia miyamotoi FR64b]ATQ14886.1 hypothetical protein CNO14_02660 [Borrelia miyamotoi]ATQ16068.1 hypothetical protein CNO13_02660 [Borrelia miyamotoi]ATQ17214.1 hypothetical protein CNO12_02665 [Borrelia miyamotoi]ATQ18280.1 hypothetical protein CNO11_01585 [Borrelia miyamotoi]
MILKSYIIILLLLFLQIALFSQVASVKEMEGQINVVRNAIPIKLDLGDEIFEYDFIEVGDNSKIKIGLYGINGVSSDLTLNSNTHSLICYSSLKDVQNAKIYLFKGSLEVVIYKVVKGSSLSVDINNYFFMTDAPSKFYVNCEYFNSYFVSVFDGVLKHYNKDEYWISAGTSILLWDNNSFLSKNGDSVSENVIQNFKEMSRKNFISLNSRHSNYIFSKYIEGSFRFDFVYDYLVRDPKFNTIYSKWSLEDKNHVLGDRIVMMNYVNYLRGRIGILFNNFIYLASMFFFIEDIVKNFSDMSDKVVIYGSILKFFENYKKDRSSLIKKFFKTIHSFKMYLIRTNGDVPSNLSINEFYLLRPREF